MKISKTARFLSRFAARSNAGIGVSEVYKMQYAIDKCGRFKIVAASILAGIGKLFGKKGIFYKVAGQEGSGLDGFYGAVWDTYADIGIELPKDPEKVCRHIYETLGISTCITDANDLGVEILAVSPDVHLSTDTLKQIIRDNPAGQGREQTPFILVRRYIAS